MIPALILVGCPKPEPVASVALAALAAAPAAAQVAEPRAVAENVAAAIEDHYRPLGPNDRVPSDPVAVTLALADKLDTLVGFWAISEKPTGSSDPYALRRAALGLIRILLSNGTRAHLTELFAKHEISRRQSLIAAALRDMPRRVPFAGVVPKQGLDLNWLRLLVDEELAFDPEDHAKIYEIAGKAAAGASLVESVWFKKIRVEEPLFHGEEPDEVEWVRVIANDPPIIGSGEGADISAFDYSDDLIAFLADRLKVQLRDQGKRHDLVDAVFALGDDDLVRIVARVEALDAFLKTEDGANLLAGYKRAANILAAEEKKGKGLSDADLAAGLDTKLLKEPAEQALYDALEKALPAARAAVEKEDFAAAMKALSQLRAPVDAFFVSVLVNAEDAMLRRNRLLLLSRLREALSAVADFSKIEG